MEKKTTSLSAVFTVSLREWTKTIAWYPCFKESTTCISEQSDQKFIGRERNSKEKGFGGRYLIVAYLIKQFIAGYKVMLTNTNILLCKRYWTVARIKEK